MTEADGTALMIQDMVERSRQRELTDEEALEELVVDNAALERLESLLDGFNIFEAIGMVSQEIRHSAFLAFLLDPSQSHGLDAALLKRILQKVLTAARNAPLPISLIDLDVWDLSAAEVRREWEHIDLLVLIPDHKVAVIIENKVYSEEHSDQLARYWETVTAQHPGWRIVGIFLTPEGIAPTDSRYKPLSYQVLTEVLEAPTEGRSSVLGTEVHILIIHYTQMLRRHIVSGSEIDILCQRIYQRHKRALDLIFERRPDRQMEIRHTLERMVSETPGFSLAVCNKQWIGFVPDAWNVQSLTGPAHPFSKQGHLLILFFENKFTQNVSTGIRLIVQICPGDGDTRQRLYQMAVDDPRIFKPSKNKSGWWTIYSCNVLTPKAVEELDMSNLEFELFKSWSQFRADDLLGMLDAVQSQDWLSSQTPSALSSTIQL